MLFLYGYIFVCVLSFFVCCYVGGYRQLEETDRMFLTAFGTFFWPLVMPVFLLYPIFKRVVTWLSKTGEDAKKRSDAKRALKAAQLENKGSYEDMYSSLTYRTFAQNKLSKKKNAVTVRRRCIDTQRKCSDG